MTITEAIADLRAKRAAMLAAVSTSIDDVGEEAVRQIQARWPVDTSRSKDGWYWNRTKGARNQHGGRVMNEVPYTEFVHDGLAFRLVPEILKELEPRFGELVTQRIDAIGSRRA